MILLCPYGLVQVTVFVLKSVQQTNTVLWLVSVSVNTVLWLVEMWWVRSLDVGDMKTNTGEMFISTGLVHTRTGIISMMFIVCQIFYTHDMFFYLLAYIFNFLQCFIFQSKCMWLMSQWHCAWTTEILFNQKTVKALGKIIKKFVVMKWFRSCYNHSV